MDILGKRSLLFQQMSFGYNSSTNNLIECFSGDCSEGWTGIAGANGTGKSTFLKLATGLLIPTSGTISITGKAIYSRQRTDDMPALFTEFLTTFNKTACKLIGLLNIEPEWQYRWDTLSHGERKRAQIATALFQEPDILAVDEPTNHLDIESKHQIMEILDSFKGIGLLVSHDRDLLDHLCVKCIFIDPPEISIFTGNYSQSYRQNQMIEKSLKNKYLKAKQTIKQLKSIENKRRQDASKSDNRISKKNISSKDHDAKNNINLVKLSGKDGSAGKQLNQISGRLMQAHNKIKDLKFKKTYKTGLNLASKKSKRNLLFQLDKGRINLSDDKILQFDDLYIKPEDRIGLTGRNGYGKTSLLNHILKQLKIDPTDYCYLPQEINIANAMLEIDKIKTLPGEILGKIMIIISRLGSRPERILETKKPSPGEIRKILLAKGLSMTPYLIIMDEPTNHLDLPSIECLEDTLKSCDSSLFLISHDFKFLNTLTNKKWNISSQNNKMLNHKPNQILKLNQRII
jgi:macrolide transport system ATP-binding/permease protein